MKIKYWKAVFLLSVLIVLSSCDEDDDSPIDEFDNSDVASIQSSLQTGTWRISSFVDDGENETVNFNDFVFTFGTDGSISADNGSNVFNGSWRVELDDDDDDDDKDDLEFYITFATTNDNLDDLTEDWYVLEFSENRIRLSDDDDDTDNDDLLTFERN